MPGLACACFQANIFSAEIYVASLRDIHPPRQTPTRSFCLLGPACLSWPVAAHLLEQLNKLFAARQDEPDIFIVVADVVVVVLLNEYLMPRLAVAFIVSIKRHCQWQVQCQTRLKQKNIMFLPRTRGVCATFFACPSLLFTYTQ